MTLLYIIFITFNLLLHSVHSVRSPFHTHQLYGHKPEYPVIDRKIGSRVADEKRRRNAAASHRLRERRKDKIKDLEKKVRELKKRNEKLETQRDFYKDRYVGNTPSPSMEMDEQDEQENHGLTAENKGVDTYEIGNSCNVDEPL